MSRVQRIGFVIPGLTTRNAMSLKQAEITDPSTKNECYEYKLKCEAIKSPMY